MSGGSSKLLGTPSRQIIDYLQRHGSATVKDLEGLLGVTTTAVRQHLSLLQAQGYVARRQVQSGVGRPHHAYTTTDQVRDLFDCHCDDLALTMLDEMLHLLGREQLPVLMGLVSDRLARRYAGQVKSEVLQERVQELADTLDKRGVLTDVLPQQDNTIILKTYNCPYHELALEHREVCEMEQGMMRRVLGSQVELSSCIMDGHGDCSFVVGGGAYDIGGRP